ncbi:Rieske 2Fe-2S domain-containing protein [Enterovirga sp.]|jgi:3-phenylpropionate/trans-cinnamate dioxygenase ferredoxin subunit|uniref:Rieske (2Fe-2S) protein n=1 Tax=Enterovirga sp. TaxID=2026350 RepID=UPI0026181F39|nr:Rieske 2Fe-2S domain-containing protein [Enterovirga sp.]MDB5591599.1 Ab [Enterovirga sp.]
MTCDRSDPPAPDGWTAVATLADLTEGALAPVEVAGHRLMLALTGARVSVCQRLCPHEYADLSRGRLDGGRVFCPRHRASFNLVDGASGGGWDLPSLRVYPTEIRGGQVWVEQAAVEADPPLRIVRIAPRV